MISKPKRKPHQGDYDRDRRHREKMLDDALKNTFPASDPLSIVLPPPTAADRDKVETSSWAALQFRKHRPALTASFSRSNQRLNNAPTECVVPYCQTAQRATLRRKSGSYSKSSVPCWCQVHFEAAILRC